MRARVRTSLQQFSSVAIALVVGGCSEETPLDPVSLAVGPATNLAATAVTYEHIYLSWQDNARNETGWEVHRSTTGPSGTFTLLRTLFGNAFQLNDLGLQALTQYCYKARSFRSPGPRTSYSEFSNVACASTLAVPVPPAPTNLNALPGCCYGISLTWTDASPLETGWLVERASSSSGPWSARVTLGPNVPSYTDSVDPEQTFCYRIIARSSFGDSGPSNVDCSAVPAAPSNLTLVASGRDANLTWTDNSAVEDGFQVERSSQTAPAAVIATLPPNTTAYRDAGLPDETYRYVVRAIKDGGNSGNSNQVQTVIASSPPAAPVGLGALAIGSTQVQVTWTDGSNNEAGFRLQRSTNGGTTWTVVTELVSPLFYDGGRTPDAQVCYRAVAFNSAGESAPSNTDCTTPPAAPTQLTATGIDGQTINLAWRDNSAVEDGYELYAQYCYYYYGYYTYCYTAFSTSLGPNTASYQFRDANAYLYSYLVQARKDGGWSDLSNEAFPTSPAGSTSGLRRP